MSTLTAPPGMCGAALATACGGTSYATNAVYIAANSAANTALAAALSTQASNFTSAATAITNLVTNAPPCPKTICSTSAQQWTQVCWSTSQTVTSTGNICPPQYTTVANPTKAGTFMAFKCTSIAIDIMGGSGGGGNGGRATAIGGDGGTDSYGGGGGGGGGAGGHVTVTGIPWNVPFLTAVVGTGGAGGGDSRVTASSTDTSITGISCYSNNNNCCRCDCGTEASTIGFHPPALGGIAEMPGAAGCASIGGGTCSGGGGAGKSSSITMGTNGTLTAQGGGGGGGGKSAGGMWGEQPGWGALGGSPGGVIGTLGGTSTTIVSYAGSPGVGSTEAESDAHLQANQSRSAHGGGAGGTGFLNRMWVPLGGNGGNGYGNDLGAQAGTAGSAGSITITWIGYYLTNTPIGTGTQPTCILRSVNFTTATGIVIETGANLATGNYNATVVPINTGGATVTMTIAGGSGGGLDYGGKGAVFTVTFVNNGSTPITVSTIGMAGSTLSNTAPGGGATAIYQGSTLIAVAGGGGGGGGGAWGPWMYGAGGNAGQPGGNGDGGGDGSESGRGIGLGGRGATQSSAGAGGDVYGSSSGHTGGNPNGVTSGGDGGTGGDTVDSVGGNGWAKGGGFSSNNGGGGGGGGYYGGGSGNIQRGGGGGSSYAGSGVTVSNFTLNSQGGNGYVTFISAVPVIPFSGGGGGGGGGGNQDLHYKLYKSIFPKNKNIYRQGQIIKEITNPKTPPKTKKNKRRTKKKTMKRKSFLE